MTISTTTNRVTYTGNGVTVAFSFPYAFFAQADLVVVETIIATGLQTVKALTTDYTISGSVDALGHYSSGGTVTAVTAPASTKTWTIYRDPTATQTTDLVENDPMPAESLEAALDYQTMLNQRTRDIAVRSLQQPEGDSATIDRLPSKVDRASMYLGFDADGDPIALDEPAGTTAVSAFMATVLDDTTASAARTTLGFPTVSGATTGHALVVDPAASGGMSWNHRAQPNPIINGSMDVWQRGTTFSGINAAAPYTADRFRVFVGGTSAVVTASRSTSVPTVAQAGVLFNYSLEIDVTTADAAIAAGDLVTVEQQMEGANWRPFAQRDVTVSFWVLSSKTGTHSVAFQNIATDRAYIATYTVTAGDTWEYKTIALPASPSAGTWGYASGIGLRMIWVLMAGSTYQGTTGSWLVNPSSASYASALQANVMDSTANFFRITGVKMELGSVATPIQFVPFEEELARCRRYYQKSFLYATAPAQNVGANTGEFTFTAPRAGALTETAPTIPLSPPMRVTPSTVTMYNTGAANAQLRDQTASADCSASGITGRSESAMSMSATGNASTAVGNTLGAHWTADAEL